MKHLFCSQYLIELYLEFIGFLGSLLFFSRIFVIVQMYMQRLWRIFFSGYNLYLFSCCYCCTSYTFLSYTGKVFSVIVHVWHCILFSKHLYNKNAWFASLYYPYVLYQLAIKHFVCDFSDKKLQRTYFILQWMLCILRMLSSKTLSNVNTQVFLMGAHVKFHQGFFFFFTWLCLFCCW